LGLLFLVLSFPQIDSLLHSFFPLTTHSQIITIVTKTCFFIVFAWVISCILKPKKPTSS
jgi:hypothetical protein